MDDMANLAMASVREFVNGPLEKSSKEMSNEVALDMKVELERGEMSEVIDMLRQKVRA